MESNMTSFNFMEFNNKRSIAYGDDPFVSYGDPFGDVDDDDDLMNTQMPIENNFLDEFDQLVLNDFDEQKQSIFETENEINSYANDLRAPEDNNESLDDNDDVFREESDRNLPRIQVELDKLNYSNESINNLELELEEAKREYARLVDESSRELTNLETQLGACVAKARPYHEIIVQLNKAKEVYQKAKNQFEQSQALYVAAKEMEIYAEDNIDLHTSNNKHIVKSNKNQATLVEILEKAKQKVQDSEKSKQKHDKIQIDAFNAYSKLQTISDEHERTLKKFIDKSRKYYELKADLDKELDFQSTKVEGLKSCLKEAKTFYQQSLKNLELISTEIHSQRQTGSIFTSLSEINNSSGELAKITNSCTSDKDLTKNAEQNDTKSVLKSDKVQTLTTNSDPKSNYRTQSTNSLTDTEHFNQVNSDQNPIDDKQKNANNKQYDCAQKVKLRPQFRASLILKNP